MVKTSTFKKSMMAAATVLAVTVSGCAQRSDAPTGAAPDSTTSAPAAGAPAGDFVSTAATGIELAPGTSLTLNFADGRLSANAGCNSMSGAVSLEDSTLTVTDLAQTEMFCEGVMDQEKWLGEFLSGSPTWALTDGVLTLTKGADTITFEAKAATPDSELEGVRWALESIVTGETASSVPAGVEPAIIIADGRITFDAQCNSVGGDITVLDSTLTVSGVLGTLMACEDARGEMESLLTATIADTVDYQVAGDQLTIDGANGTTLIFRATEVTPDATTVPESTDFGTVPSAVEPPVDATETAVSSEKISESIPEIPEDSSVTGAATDTPAIVDPVLAGLSFVVPIEGQEAVITLSFTERILTNAGCNSISALGPQSTTDGVLAVGTLRSTRMFCEGISEAETAWMDFLQSSPTWALDGPTLTLTSGDLSYTLTSTT